MNSINYFKSKVAYNRLLESKKTFVLKEMNIYTNNYSVKFNKGEEIKLGTTSNGDLAIRESKKTFITNDSVLAEKILSNCVRMTEMSVPTETKVSILEAVSGNVSDKDIVQAVVDEKDIEVATKDIKDRLKGELTAGKIVGWTDKEGDLFEVALPKMTLSKRSSISEKVEKLTCKYDSIKPELIHTLELSEDNDDLFLHSLVLKEDEVDNAEFNNLSDFKNEVNNLGGNVLVNGNENLAVKDNEYFGEFNEETGEGVIYNTNFNNQEELNNYTNGDLATTNAVDNFSFENENLNVSADLEAALENLKNTLVKGAIEKATEEIEALTALGIGTEEATEIVNVDTNIALNLENY
jgi:hypothetical protein